MNKSDEFEILLILKEMRKGAICSTARLLRACYEEVTELRQENEELKKAFNNQKNVLKRP